MQTTTRHRTLPILKAERRKVNPVSVVFLLLIIAAISYALYIYQFKPLLTMKLPEHQPLPTDTPPQELTSFQVRESGDLLTPLTTVTLGDTICVSFRDKSMLYLYGSDLTLLRKVDLNRPERVVPTSMAVSDSFLIVADSAKQVFAVYDHDGDYLTSSAWYPNQSSRINPLSVSADNGVLALIDWKTRRTALISLIDRQPFYTFLELIKVVPSPSMVAPPGPSCALMTPDSNIWIGDRTLNRAFIFAPNGRVAHELEQPKLSSITTPVDFAVVWNSPKHSVVETGAVESRELNSARVHMLDRDAGKVFVYDLSGMLTLVYPRDRKLNGPTSIDIEPQERHIFITESKTQEITVFGY
jgi:hypothetical protein